MDSLYDSIEGRKASHGPKQEQGVKIAILDTGYSTTRRRKSTISHRVFYKDFLLNEDEDGNRNSWRDDVGHGTHSTSLLLNFVPDAEIYVARVFEGRIPRDDELDRVAEVSRHRTCIMWQY